MQASVGMASAFAVPHSGQVMVEVRMIGSGIGIAEIEENQAQEETKRHQAPDRRSSADSARTTISRFPLAPQRERPAGDGQGGDREQRHAKGCRKLGDATEPRRAQAGTREQDWEPAARGGGEGGTQACHRKENGADTA